MPGPSGAARTGVRRIRGTECNTAVLPLMGGSDDDGLPSTTQSPGGMSLGALRGDTIIPDSAPGIPVPCLR
jgi:hypothetical protein